MSIITSLDTDTPAVFGTFGVQYNTAEFEREREDGFSVLGMVPDCRVFIYGTEFTKDIKDVSITNSINGNTCELTIQNPRGKYEITKQDLMGKWREDKDILLSYDYNHFKRISKKESENFMDKISPSLFGRKTSDQIKKGMNLTTTINSQFGYNFGVPKVRGVTRQIFETKYYSGLSKYTGDVVFDYKDPVFVFFKGRFSPLWYFGFTGIVTGWDDSDTYGQGEVIRLKCEDITAVWKRSRLTTQGAMFAFSRGEGRTRNTQKGTAYRLTEDLAASFNFTDMIKMAVFSYDFSKFVNNCHASAPGKYVDAEKDSYSADLTDSDEYKDARRALQSDALIDSGEPTMGAGQTDTKSGRYMFTRANPFESGGFGADFSGGEAAWSGSTAGGSGYKSFGSSYGATNSSKNNGLIDISKITYLHTNPKLNFGTKSYLLNEAPYGPSVSLYMQLNEIEFPENVKFTGKNLKAYLDISVRYWEAQHKIADSFPALKTGTTQIKGTGWVDNKAFGIAGVHPALTYEFISNFGTLNNIWEQLFKHKKDLENVIMTPNDKIRSMVGGEPTELADQSSMKGSNPAGTAFNFFRPRLFVILPRRFSDRYKKSTASKFGEFGNLFKQTSTNIYQFLTEKLKGMEYVLYASPCGDVFVEPELYDFHPLEFSTRIEEKSIIKKKLEVRFKATSGENEEPVSRADNAYFFDPKVNHPFFIMEKDRMRVTQTFDHKLIHTEIKVQGGTTNMGGVTEVIDSSMKDMMADIQAAGQSKGNQMKSNMASGVYIADGFQKHLDPNSTVSTTKTTYEEGLVELNKSVFKKMHELRTASTISTMVKDYINNMMAIYEESVESESLKTNGYILWWDTAYRINEVLSEYGETTPSDAQVALILKLLFPGLNSYKINTTFSELITTVINKKDAETAKSLNSTNLASKRTVLGGANAAYTESLTLLNDLTPAANKNGDARALYDLIEIGTVIYREDTAISPMIDSVIQDYILYSDAGGGDNVQIRNIAEERAAAIRGIYDPRLDMVKHYGYNPKEPIINYFIKGGNEAYEYARTVFNRLKGKAFQINMDVIGRPEFCLNRPYYCERKDSIGLLTKFTLNYSYGDSFRSNVGLEYIRKNSITYKYSLGELDAFSKTTYNDMFLQQADTYYKMNKNSPALVGKLSGALTSAITGSSPGAQRSEVTKAVGGVTNKLVSAFLPPGGIYSAHDRIGHIPFDTRFNEINEAQEIAVNPELQNSNPNEVQAYTGALNALFTMSNNIKQILVDRQTKKDSLESSKKKKAVVDKKIPQLETTANNLKNQIKSSNTPEQRTKFLTQWTAAEKDWNKAMDESADLETSMSDIEYQIDDYNEALYGDRISTPADLTKYISKAFETLNFLKKDKNGNPIATIPEADAIMISDGLLYSLFDMYVNATSMKDKYDIYNIYETKGKNVKIPKKKFGPFGTTEFYIEIKPGVDLNKLSDSQKAALFIEKNVG